MNYRIKKLTIMAMMTALCLVCVALIRIPIFPAAPFLTYEPKDVIIVLCGFIFGPVEAITVAVLAAVIEMITISSTGIWGCLMNILSSVAFAGTASLIYSAARSKKRALAGLGCSIAAQVACMLLWNYFVTPIYMGYPREAVAAMLPTIFLPFNLIKSSINSVLAFLVYKPLVSALRRGNLIPENRSIKAAQAEEPVPAPVVNKN